MRKIPTMFERDWEGDRSRVTDQVVPGCEWVLDGEGLATRKYDGTCVMYDGEKWWARREVKDGKTPPEGFVSSGHDHITLKNIGWEPIGGSPFAKFHAEALDREFEGMDDWPEGTYELIGPKVQGNPEGCDSHELILHQHAEVLSAFNPGDGLRSVERTYDGLRDALEFAGWEGFVFHHEDGRMAKIKGRDFGLTRR